MSKLQDALDQIKDPTVADAKIQFAQLINEGKAASEAFINSSAEQLEQWTIDVSDKKLPRMSSITWLVRKRFSRKTSWPVRHSLRKNARKS